MEITEVHIKLMEVSSERLKAFCSITFDDSFAIRDLKIIEGTSGPFVAMPSRKPPPTVLIAAAENHLRAAFCNQCGARCKNRRPSATMKAAPNFTRTSPIRSTRLAGR